MNLLFFCACDLHELAAHHDPTRNQTLRFGDSYNGLKIVASVSVNADSLLRKMKLVEVEVILQLLDTADEMVFYSAGMEHALASLCRHSEYTTHAFALNPLVSERSH